VRRGTRLGIDVGSARVGVSRSDPEGLMAVAMVTLDRSTAAIELARLVIEYEPLELVVGLPISLQGRETSSTQDARDFVQQLRTLVSTPIRLVDERLSTVQAAAGFREAGRSAKKQRGVIDQAAAVILLQYALDAERIQGVPPGLLDNNPPHDD
jgi:putative holliday junction resolvase